MSDDVGGNITDFINALALQPVKKSFVAHLARFFLHIISEDRDRPFRRTFAVQSDFAKRGTDGDKNISSHSDTIRN